MVKLSLAEKGKKEYEKVCLFAKEIFSERLEVEYHVFPDLFIYAEEDEKIIGCFGLVPAVQRNPLTVETFFNFNILEYLSGGKTKDRALFGEAGCLAIAKHVKSYISLILTTGLVISSYYLGYRYLALTTTKFIQRMAEPLGVNLINIGNPDWSKKDKSFQEAWKKYSSLRPDSVGIDILQALGGCFIGISKFNEIDYSGIIPENAIKKVA